MNDYDLNQIQNAINCLADYLLEEDQRLSAYHVGKATGILENLMERNGLKESDS
jgi:hypothetical protein